MKNASNSSGLNLHYAEDGLHQGFRSRQIPGVVESGRDSPGSAGILPAKIVIRVSISPAGCRRSQASTLSLWPQAPKPFAE
jgi:hypothetical protein